MWQAIDQLSSYPDYLLVDGLRFTPSSFTCQTIVDGDQLSLSIAAASIIAKVTRDRLMRDYHLTMASVWF